MKTYSAKITIFDRVTKSTRSWYGESRLTKVEAENDEGREIAELQNNPLFKDLIYQESEIEEFV